MAVNKTRFYLLFQLATAPGSRGRPGGSGPADAALCHVCALPQAGWFYRSHIGRVAATWYLQNGSWERNWSPRLATGSDASGGFSLKCHTGESRSTSRRISVLTELVTNFKLCFLLNLWPKPFRVYESVRRRSISTVNCDSDSNITVPSSLITTLFLLSSRLSGGPLPAGWTRTRCWRSRCTTTARSFPTGTPPTDLDITRIAGPRNSFHPSGGFIGFPAVLGADRTANDQGGSHSPRACSRLAHLVCVCALACVCVCTSSRLQFKWMCHKKYSMIELINHSYLKQL